MLGLGMLATCDTPAAVTDHPRLWINSSDLPRLRPWATSGNPVYQNGLLAAATQAKYRAEQHWNWSSGEPDSGWQDDGGINQVYDVTESYAELFAFMSLVDGNAGMRPQWAMRARAMLMWLINKAANSPAGQPFNQSNFATNNRANYYGQAWGLTVDWIYPYLSPADKAAIHNVFLRWANSQLNASTAGNEHPQPIGVTNDPQLLGSSPTQGAYQQQVAQLQLRWAANNYYLGHMRQLALMSLAFDPADDPPLDPSKPADLLGNSLGSYLANVMGAWLYQAYAVFEDAAKVAADLNLPAGNRSLGVASGGLPVEGSLYGESLGFLLHTLLALHTAGHDDTSRWGPQAGFLKSPFWDQAIDGLYHSLTPTATVPASEPWLGPIYGKANYGDLLRTWETPANIHLVGTLGIFDLAQGNTGRLRKEAWYARNALEGGANGLYQRIVGATYPFADMTDAILYFLLLDPEAPVANDPRPGMSTRFVSLPIGRILARSGWNQNSSWFDFRCSWETINHQLGDCMQFEFHRNGEWLTKEWSGYSNDMMATLPTHHNSLSLRNDIPASLAWLWQPTADYGGQWHNGGNNGDPSVALSVTDAWAYAQADATNLYNHPDWWTAANQAQDIKHASRSIVWLNPDAIVVYDRATSGKAGRFKHFNLTLTAKPTITGDTARVTLPSGQGLTVQALLPAGVAMSEQHAWIGAPAQEFNSEIGRAHV
jgi:hypothetical protein